MASPPLFILLCSGEHEKLHMAAMMASVAAVSERAVEVFVSMNAIFAFLKEPPEGERYKGGAFSSIMSAKNVPDTMQLFEQGRMLGDLKIWPCSMALDVTGLGGEAFLDGLFDAPAGLTKFLSDAETGQLVVM